MNIRKCYIENFGKLHNFKHEFSEGLNIINESNGWGKSTFATFIKAMFFGFDSSNKRAISENERKKYYPWQGGKFGGNLEFEIDGKIYEIERFFGLKDKEDTFKLYNKSTNCECDDFSENIGEEIFKIDKQAYERSTYIPQQNISVEINDSLSAKLSNILESGNDIDSSDNAINKINLAMKEYKKTGNKGKINELEAKINNKKRELEYAQKNEELINERNKKIEQIKLEIKKYEEERNKNQEKINQITEQEKNKIKKERYEEICNTLKQDEEKLEKLNKFFNNKIPEDEEIKKCEENMYQLDILFAKLDESVVEDEDRNKYEKLKSKFNGMDLDEEKINNYYTDYNEIQNLEKDLILLKEKLETQEKIEKIQSENKKQRNNKMIISILIILLAIILGIFVSKYLYLISVLGIIILTLGLNKKDKNKNTEEISKVGIINEIDEKNIKINTLNKQIMDFINLFENLQGSVLERINNIKTDFIAFKNLNNIINSKENKRTEYQNNIDELIEEIYTKLMHYLDININTNNISDFNSICKNVIFEIKNKKREYGNLIIKIEEDKKLKQKYEEENNIKEIIINDNLEDKQKILEINDKLTNNIKSLINQKSYDENEINRLINTSVPVEEIENEIENLEEELIEVNRKYNILDKTQKYLTKAKEEFSSHYLQGMTDGFEKYINIINGEKLNTNIDVKLNVKVQEYGEKKDIEYLSTGYKDLIGICMRFALVDALFENEKPFIILDDPFVNLDKSKIEKAKELVKELSKKYQVIYFICHESRK